MNQSSRREVYLRQEYHWIEGLHYEPEVRCYAEPARVTMLKSWHLRAATCPQCTKKTKKIYSLITLDTGEECEGKWQTKERMPGGYFIWPEGNVS